jgi:threonylcarbamoyladenosine tRNA methylthiotransferase CDKAL1
MRVYVEGYGCSQNLGETHRLAEELERSGCQSVHDPREADVAILVTCGVIGSTEQRMVRRWRALAERTPRLVVTGCLVPLRASLFSGPARERTLFVPIRDQRQLRDRLAPDPTRDPERRPERAVPNGPEPTAAAVAAEVVVAQGCTSHCTYCFSRLARGPLVSVPEGAILARVAEKVRQGAIEIRLSSLDTSCWGVDLPASPRLPDLLGAVAAIPGDFRVRVGMMSPQSLAPIGEAYLGAVRAPRFYRFLHLPVQNGSDEVLRSMRRGYRVDEFRYWVDRARSIFRDLMLATDVIVGFPSETEADFEATLRLIESVQPEVLNVTRFSARPLTPADRLPSLPPGTVKRRSRQITELRLRLARGRMERWVGREETGWIVEHGHEGTSMARLTNYLPVVLTERLPLRMPVRVQIEGARSTYLLGRRAAGSPPEERTGSAPSKYGFPA